MKYLLIILFSITASANNNHTDDLDTFLSNSKAWVTAYYAIDETKMSSLQTEKMNSNIELAKSRLGKVEIPNTPRYSCNVYYIKHQKVQNELPVKGLSQIIGGSEVFNSPHSAIHITVFNECGIEVVQHLSGITLIFEEESKLLNSYRTTMAQSDLNGYSSEYIEAELIKFEEAEEQKYTPLKDLNFDKQVEALKSQFNP